MDSQEILQKSLKYGLISADNLAEEIEMREMRQDAVIDRVRKNRNKV